MPTTLTTLARVAALAAALAGSAAAQQPAAAGRAFRVIVNAENPVSTLDEAEVSRLFLRKTATWQSGEPVLPIEQAKGSPVRVAFEREIHKKSDSELERYWQVMVFTGKGSPPPTRTSDADVIELVRHSLYAIAYVSAAATLPPDIKSVTIAH